ncbi:MAG: exodeoxyribonuclease VII large subunit [Clostridia bacterium]|nr:exodeoxyribonuclease VII large subunit [Clostridia bacterium]MBQ4625141.1 exodeoxyribonuclease VII large subunit [Clostridia bacterium]
MQMASVLTVSEVNQYIKLLIEHDDLLADVMVKGEISNYKRHSSGHLYFTMKDEGGALLCVMFRGEASKLKFAPSDGMKVIAAGRLSVFVRDGRYQLYITDLQPDGVGALYAAFEQLKEKLYKEGLFDQSRKKPIPSMPMKIALVTSPTGAAVRDMIRVLGKRFPLAKLLVCPVRVQGEGAAEEIAKALKLLSDKRTVDLIILGRGGGSIEDLWPFNEEIVARAIAACNTPIISAVGHEPDVTISDFVADLRAATPSNGAELAVPDSNELYITLRNFDIRLVRAMDDRLKKQRLRLKELAGRKSLSGPTYRINEQRLLLDYLEKTLSSSVERHLADKRHRYTALKSTIEAISPLAVLGRGYSIASIEGKAIRSAREVIPGDRVRIRLLEGQLVCLVEETKE